MKAASLGAVLWPDRALGQVIADLSRASGFSPRLRRHPIPPVEALGDLLLLDRWMEAAAEYFGVEAESVETTFVTVESMLARAAPCVLRVPLDTRDPSGRGYLAVVARRGRWLEVVLPGLLRRRVLLAEVARALRVDIEAELTPRIDEWTRSLPVSPKARQRAHNALRDELAAGASIGGVWLLRPKPGAPFLSQLRHSGDIRRLGLFLFLHVLAVGLALRGWSSLVDVTVSGTLESAELYRWVLLSLSVAFVEVARGTIIGQMNVSVASLLKRRVLAGALRLDPNDIRTRGSGGILALISETEVLETAGIASALHLLSALVSLVSAGFVLGHGAAGGGHIALLIVWTLLIVAAISVMHRRTRRWVDFRVEMTNGLVERMVGHRTRMAQERPEGRHRAEDAELDLYLAESRGVDRLARILQGLPSRGWLLCGFAALLPALWRGTVETASLLVSVGGLFIAQSAFASVSDAVTSLLSMTVAWQRAGALFRAAAEDEPHGLPAASVQELGAAADAAPGDGGGVADSGAVLDARSVSFRYPGSGEPVLRGVSLRLTRGERVLLQGASGGGKSTLLSLLAGLRDPDAGLVLHHGADRATLGTATWRRKVASVPQFHENHVLSGSLLFNLLLGRRWPPTDSDRKLAEEVCRELNLGPLLDRMPSGLEQIVGETGWQLSHGERTRVFLARALLQGADVVLVDESFGALDPHNLRIAVDTTFRRASTLLVIAHP